MLKLFTYEGYNLKVAPEALLLTPLKKLWERDRSKKKERALNEFGFLYFYSDPRSDYQYLTDPLERISAIKEGEGLGPKWKPDKLVLEAVDFYESFMPIGTLLLEDTRYAINKLRKLLRDVDLTTLDDKGKPIYTLNVITNTIKQIPGLVRELNNAERDINTDIRVSTDMRGLGEKTVLEDGFNID